VTLDRLWAGWRTEYVGATGEQRPASGGCVFCRILSSDEPDEVTKIVWRDDKVVVLLNAFPYTSGHFMVLPARHVGEIEELEPVEATGLWAALSDGVRALKAAYEPDGVNIGANLGRAAGAGVLGHFHVHAVPRWVGDTNFMTAVAELRVLPETLDTTWEKLRRAWPSA
jgi:ATP adenylyltransferase